MTYQARVDSRLKGPGLRIPGVARQLAAGASSANTALTVGCERISILAVTADIRYSLGTTAQTASASTSHLIKNGERLELDVPQHLDFSATGDPASIANNANYGNLLASNIAVIRDDSTSGTLEVTEFTN
tara:strand:+ start:140 stop:529 length:390 start_codon:yes stop_codon:yes gene_type:complete